MLNLLVLTPVYGDIGRVQGAGRMYRQRWGEHPAAEGLAKPPIPHPALLLPPPCCPPEWWALLGGPVPF